MTNLLLISKLVPFQLLAIQNYIGGGGWGWGVWGIKGLHSGALRQKNGKFAACGTHSYNSAAAALSR